MNLGTLYCEIVLTIDFMMCPMNEKMIATVYAMVERRQLPGVVRLGRRVLIRTEVLLNSLSQSRAPSLKE